MKLTKKKGFTLIEIVIVLAIAALILIIVFLAVTGAQRSRRDEQRRTDLNRVAAQLETWAGNNSGDYPNDTGATGSWLATTPRADEATAYNGDFGNSYLDSLGNLADPSLGNSYVVTVGDSDCTGDTGTPTNTGGAGTIHYDRVAERDYDMCISLEQGVYERDLVTP